MHARVPHGSGTLAWRAIAAAQQGTEVGACLLIVARREQISGVAPAAGLTVLCVRASGLRALYGSDAYSNAVQLLCPGLNT